MDRYKDFDY